MRWKLKETNVTLGIQILETRERVETKKRNQETFPSYFFFFLLFLFLSCSFFLFENEENKKGGSGSQSSVEDSSQFLGTIFHPLSLLHLSMFSPIYFLVVSSLSLSLILSLILSLSLPLILSLRLSLILFLWFLIFSLSLRLSCGPSPGGQVQREREGSEWEGRVRWGSQLDVLGQSLSRSKSREWKREREWAREQDCLSSGHPSSHASSSLSLSYPFFLSPSFPFFLLVLKYKLQSAN